VLNPRGLQLKASSLSCPQSSQRGLRKASNQSKIMRRESA